MALPANIFDLARSLSTLHGADVQSLLTLYHITGDLAKCRVGPLLSSKYNVTQHNEQLVVCVSNRLTLEQTWFNEERTRKPQTFQQQAAVLDPTEGGKKCDFCQPYEYTAEDSWGRVELPHALTGSNLFKYCEPCHGIVLFRHHNPLEFSLQQLSDLTAASQQWFQRSHACHQDAKHAFLIWNCLARAGASQFHGHAQRYWHAYMMSVVMLSRAPLPAQQRLDQAAAQYGALHARACYYRALLRAHRAAKLLRACGSPAGDAAFAVAHLAPIKDMEVLVLGSSLRSPAFCRVLHAALRALIDLLGCQTFNVGMLNVECTAAAPAGAGTGAGLGSRPVLARIVSRGKLSSAASDFGTLEVVGGASIGHTDPYKVIAAVEQQLGSHAAEPTSFQL